MELNDAIALLTTYNRWRRGEDESLDMPNPREIGLALDTVLAAVTEGGTGNSGVERPEPSPHFLQKGDSPETDALLRQQDRDSTPYDLSADQLAKLCRKLERERIEARQQERIHYDNTLAMQKERDNALTELEMWRDGCIVREEDKVERDQWRRCAEGLAFIVKNSAADYSILRDREAALAEFERLKEGG